MGLYGRSLGDCVARGVGQLALNASEAGERPDPALDSYQTDYLVSTTGPGATLMETRNGIVQHPVPLFLNSAQEQVTALLDTTTLVLNGRLRVRSTVLEGQDGPD